VNQLRQLMLKELRRRDLADTTIRTYMHGVTPFSWYFRRSPDRLGPEDIRKYQAMLFTKLKYSPNTVSPLHNSIFARHFNQIGTQYEDLSTSSAFARASAHTRIPCLSWPRHPGCQPLQPRHKASAN